MVLIIAEKPSLGRNIAGALNITTKKDGYLEGDGILVTWAIGHLFSLCDIETYQGIRVPEGERARWTLEGLPCFPEQFRYELRKKDGKTDFGVKRQFSIISSLCNRPDVDTIVNAGDADREGEIIVRLCIGNGLSPEKRAGKKFKRLWLPDQTPETVRKAYEEMEDDEKYDNLAAEGFARTYIDWLYGINLTRLATLRTGRLMRVGRVIVPIVQAICDRDLAIRDFVPEKYYQPTSKAKTAGEVVELVSKKKFDKEDKDKADALCREYNACEATVKSAKEKEGVIFPGKLYSLSTLQNTLGKKYKMSMSDSLAIVQKLYEAGYLTYPRTNSEYLATAEKDKVAKILANVAKIGYPVKFKNAKSIFDDSKIEAHSAITPTYKIPHKNQLSEKETQVYSTVFRRFVAVFCANDCKCARQEVVVAVGDREEFTLKGLSILEPGWMKYDDATQKDKVIPHLSEGDRVNIDFLPAEKTTQPPKHYTIETLNQYLKNPFRDEKANAEDTVGADDAEEYRAMLEGVELGTEATRTSIIDNARQSKYIELRKDVYTILPDGIRLCDSLRMMQIKMDKFKTSEMGRQLKRVYHGECSLQTPVKLAEEEIRSYFEQCQAEEIRSEPTTVGKCPLCGGEVIHDRYYLCSGRENGCTLRIPFFLCGKNIGVSDAEKLLTVGKTDLIRGFVGKKGTAFDAFLVLKDGKVEFEFPPRNFSPHYQPYQNQNNPSEEAKRHESERSEK